MWIARKDRSWFNSDAFVCRSHKGLIELATFISTQHKLESFGKRIPQLGKFPYQLNYEKACGVFCLLMVDVAMTHSLWAVPPLSWSLWIV